jgi:hypothetical protein
MPTNNFPNIGFTTNGRDYNFFQKITVTAASFGANSVSSQQPDAIITFPTAVITFQLEGSGSVQYSFNGLTIDGDMTSGLSSANLVFENRVVSKIWFQLVSGSPIIRIEAWGER